MKTLSRQIITKKRLQLLKLQKKLCVICKRLMRPEDVRFFKLSKKEVAAHEECWSIWSLLKNWKNYR